ncbi:UNVERIFIED_CONTAM: hypothetical protein K2H54_063797 [Gekko kuhli]
MSSLQQQKALQSVLNLVPPPCKTYLHIKHPPPIVPVIHCSFTPLSRFALCIFWVSSLEYRRLKANNQENVLLLSGIKDLLTQSWGTLYIDKITNRTPPPPHVFTKTGLYKNR